MGTTGLRCALHGRQRLWIPYPWAMQRRRNPRRGSAPLLPLNRRSDHFESVQRADRVWHTVQPLSGLAKRVRLSLAFLHELKGRNQLRQGEAPSGAQATQDGRLSGVSDMGNSRSAIPGYGERRRKQYGGRRCGPWLATRHREAEIPPTPVSPEESLALELAAMPPSVVERPRDRRY